MQKVLFYVRNKLKKNIDFSKIGLVFRKLNDKEYYDLLDGFKSIILEDNELQLAKDYYDFKNKKKEFTDTEKIQLFDNLSKSKNEKTIINIYNGFSKNAFEVLTLKNIEYELNNFLIAEIDTKEFNKHFYKDYIYDLIPKIIDFSNYIASNDGNYKAFGQCKMCEYKGVKNDENLIEVLILILLTCNDTCSLNEKRLKKL